MKKLVGIVIVATGISFGFPAHAQSFDPDNGTGNLITANAAPEPVVLTRNSGTNAYAMSARRKATSEAGSSYNAEPAYRDNGNTGGGSVGYNEMLRNW